MENTEGERQVGGGMPKGMEKMTPSHQTIWVPDNELGPHTYGLSFS